MGMDNILLLGLLLAAAATATATATASSTFRAEQGTVCEPAMLASELLHHCGTDMPTAECCGAVLTAVDLGGGVPCLCRATAETNLVVSGLNAAHLFALYSRACGGFRSFDVAVACAGAADLHVTTSAPPPSETSSNHLTGEHRCEIASDLSLVVSTECRTGQASDQCCGSLHTVMAGGGIVPCMCVLANTTAMTDARIGIRDLVNVYSACGHIRPGDLHFPSSACELNQKEVAPPAATPPPKLRPTWTPPPPQPQHSSSTPTVADIKEDEIEKLKSIVVSYNRLVVVIVSAFALIFVVLAGTAIYLFIAGQRRNRAQVHRQEDQGFEMPRIHVQPRVIIPQEIQVNPPTAEDIESIVLNPPKKRKKHYELGIPRRSDPLAATALLKESSSSSGSLLVY